MTKLTRRKKIIKHCIETAPNGAVTVIDLWARYKHFIDADGNIDAQMSPKDRIVEYHQQLQDLLDAGIINIDNANPLIAKGNEDTVTLTGI